MPPGREGRTRARLAPLTFALFLLFGLLTGCWSRREIENLAVVTAVGFDKVTVAGRDKYRLVVQVVRPAAVGARQADGGQAGGGRPAWVASALGDSLADALQNLFTRSSRYLFLAHANFIVVGERLAREEGMEEVMDLLLRHKDLRLRSWLFVAKGSALEVLRAGPELERLLAQEVTGMTLYTQPQASKGYRIHVKDFAVSLAAPGWEPLAGKLEVFVPREEPLGDAAARQTGTSRPATAVRLTGASVFRSGRLVGWLGDRETMGLLVAEGKAVRGAIPLQLRDKNPKPVVFLLTRASSTRQVTLRNGRLVASIRIKAEGDLAEAARPLLAGKEETLISLEKQAAGEIRRLVRLALNRAQHDFRADIFGLGALVQKTYPRQWPAVAEKWPQVFAALPVEIAVEVHIRRTGLIGNTITFMD